MSETVIALDPGGRTGWAAARMDVDEFEYLGGGVLAQAAMARQLAMWQSVHYVVPGHHHFEHRREYDVIVAESWRPREVNGSMDWIKGDPLLSVQHLGQIRLIADLSQAKYREYGPAQKASFTASMPPQLLGLDELSSEQHDKDARMHLWGYFFEEWFTATIPADECVDV